MHGHSILKGVRNRFGKPKSEKSTYHENVEETIRLQKEPSPRTSQSALEPSISDAATSTILSADSQFQSQGLNSTLNLVLDTPDDSEDLWQKSFEELSPKEQCLLRDLLKPDQVTSDDQSPVITFKSTDLDELIVITEQRQEQLSGRTWNFDFLGRKIVPREYTERVINCLTTVGDISVPLMPQPASIVWPLVKGLMQVRITE
jgi:hypothetical protein